VPLHGETSLSPPGQYTRSGKPAKNKSLHGQMEEATTAEETSNGKNPDQEMNYGLAGIHFFHSYSTPCGEEKQGAVRFA
jgi:hypothetical protein